MPEFKKKTRLLGPRADFAPLGNRRLKKELLVDMIEGLLRLCQGDERARLRVTPRLYVQQRL